MRVDFEQLLNDIGEVGFVERSVASLVWAEGLPGAKLKESVVFESGEEGEVSAVSENAVEILSFSKNPIKTGMRVARTNHLFEIPVGKSILGKVITPLGRSVNAQRPLPPMEERRFVDINPPGIQSRSRVKRFCETGVSLVDFMVPIGKGQRELIIGDRQTGKSRFLLRSLYSQVKQGAVGVYAVIGKSQMAIKQVEEQLTQMGVMDKTAIIASSADDSASSIYLTPYSAMTVAEYFRDQGKDVLLILDDLSVHAKVYREISLLGKKFPGRNSYPGDIFYTHARLLERAGNFMTDRGETAITCFPVAETVGGDMTAYIVTNLMSMTDGHIYFDHSLFAEGRRPAVDAYLSVSRVGRQTQSNLRREISRLLTSFLKEAERLRGFASFGEEVREHIKSTLDKENHIMIFFDQTAYDRVPGNLQIFLFGLAWSGRWKHKTRAEIRAEVQRIFSIYEAEPSIKNRIDRCVASSESVAALIGRLGDFEFLT